MRRRLAAARAVASVGRRFEPMSNAPGLVLGIDAGLSCGWALYQPGEVANCGVLDLRYAADLGERPVENLVAGDLDDDDFDPIFGNAMGGGEQPARFMSLGQRER